jgi:hypothetical protein
MNARIDKGMGKMLKVGDWVEVRSKGEILATLDENGCLDSVPFMPEMLQFCGRRFRVQKSAHKTCDYSKPGVCTRRVRDTVHLETRCDGSAHDGCQAGCMLYWKSAWLKVVSARVAFVPEGGAQTSDRSGGCTEADLWARTKTPNSDPAAPRYVCQTTQVPLIGEELWPWDFRQYLKDYWSGNVTLGRLIWSSVYSIYYNISEAGIGAGRPLRWFYNKLRFLWGGSLWPRTPGVLAPGSPTPTVSLNLQPGELVRIKSHEEILKTVTSENLNRGMRWDAELVPYCGGTYRVLNRVSRLIHEQTGKMTEMKTPCITLDSVVCQGRYTFGRMMCPKAMYPYWREIWLERVNATASDTDTEATSKSVREPGVPSEPVSIPGTRG